MSFDYQKLMPLNNEPNFNESAWETGFRYFVRIGGLPIYVKYFYGFPTTSFAEYARRRMLLASENLPEDHPFYPRDPAVVGLSQTSGLKKRRYTREELAAHLNWMQQRGLVNQEYLAIRTYEQNRTVDDLRRKAVTRDPSLILEVQDPDRPLYAFSRKRRVYLYPDVSMKLQTSRKLPQ